VQKARPAAAPKGKAAVNPVLDAIKDMLAE
jgi:hypothetical protein